MIRAIKKPDKHFDHLGDGKSWTWFVVYYNDTVCAYVGVEVVGSLAAIHVKVFKWNHNVLKVWREDWAFVKNFCKTRGANTMVASNTDMEDTVWPKFIEMFGFPSPQKVLISNQEI